MCLKLWTYKCKTWVFVLRPNILCGVLFFHVINSRKLLLIRLPICDSNELVVSWYLRTRLHYLYWLIVRLVVILLFVIRYSQWYLLYLFVAIRRYSLGYARLIIVYLLSLSIIYCMVEKQCLIFRGCAWKRGCH